MQTSQHGLPITLLLILSLGYYGCSERPMQTGTARTGNAAVAAASADGATRAQEARPPAARAASSSPEHWEIAATLLGHGDRVLSIVFSPDGERLFSGSFDGQINAWGVDGRHLEASVSAHSEGRPLRVLAVSPDGKHLASASVGSSSEVKLWDAQSLELQRTLVCRSPVYCLAFSPDSEHIAAAGEHEVNFWSLESGLQLRKLDIDTVPVFGLAFSPDGEVLYTAGSPHRGRFFAKSGVVRAWAARTGSKLGEVELPHTAFGIALSTDGATLAVATVALHVFDIVRAADKVSITKRFSALDQQTRGGVQYFQEQFGDVAIGPGGSVIAGAAGSPGPNAPDVGHVSLFDEKGDRLLSLRTPRPPRAVAEAGHYEIQAVAIAPSGNLIAAGGNEGIVTLWSRTSIGKLSDDPSQPTAANGAPNSDEKSWSADGRSEASGVSLPLPEDASPVARQVWELHHSHRSTRESLRQALRSSGKDGLRHEQQPIEEAMSDRAQYAERLLEIARDHPDDEAGFDALALSLFLCRTPSSAQLGERRREAIELLGNTYFAGPELSRVFYMLERVPSREAEELLQRGLAEHPDAGVRAHACYSLAQYYRHLSQSSRLYQQNPHLRGEAERAFGGDAVTSLQSMDPEELKEESESLYEQVQQHYPKIRKRPETYSRLEDHQIELFPMQSLGELAKSRLATLRQLAVGQKAPEIAGEDIDGTPFALSDYRGRVVALVFSADWCGPCRQMYEDERALVEQLKDEPFALLHVNSDFNRSEVKGLMDNGTITWRCWWDGPGAQGPISTQWRIEARPDIYVLDRDGVIRYRGVRGESLTRAVRQLLLEMTPG